MKIIACKNKISKIIIAIPSITEEQNFKLLEKLSPYCNFIESLPRKKYFKNKDVDIRDLEKILIEEIDNSNNTKLEESELSQKNILLILRELINKGQITLRDIIKYSD